MLVFEVQWSLIFLLSIFSHKSCSSLSIPMELVVKSFLFCLGLGKPGPGMGLSASEPKMSYNSGNSHTSSLGSLTSHSGHN